MLLEQFKETAVYDHRAERAIEEVDFDDEAAVRSQLPRYLVDLDPHRRDAKFYPSLMIFLHEQGRTNNLGAVVETVYPEAELKNAVSAK